MVTPGGHSLDLLDLMNFIICVSFWVLGNIVTSIVSNSHFGERPVIRNTSILGSHVGPRLSENVNSYPGFVQNSAARLSPGLIFSFVLLPCD